MKKLTYINIICSCFITLFLYASISKLLDLETFKAQLEKSPLLSDFPGLVSWVIPATEIIIVLFLFTSQHRLKALYASLVLMCLFTIYIIIILNFSTNIPCSCGGVLSIMKWDDHLIFNLFFIALAIIGIILHQNPFKRNTTLTTS